MARGRRFEVVEVAAEVDAGEQETATLLCT